MDAYIYAFKLVGINAFVTLAKLMLLHDNGDEYLELVSGGNPHMEGIFKLNRYELMTLGDLPLKQPIVLKAGLDTDTVHFKIDDGAIGCFRKVQNKYTKIPDAGLDGVEIECVAAFTKQGNIYVRVELTGDDLVNSNSVHVAGILRMLTPSRKRSALALALAIPPAPDPDLALAIPPAPALAPDLALAPASGVFNGEVKIIKVAECPMLASVASSTQGYVDYLQRLYAAAQTPAEKDAIEGELHAVVIALMCGQQAVGAVAVVPLERDEFADVFG
jgi:hypothetical protein